MEIDDEEFKIIDNIQFLGESLFIGRTDSRQLTLLPLPPKVDGGYVLTSVCLFVCLRAGYLKK